MHVPIAREETLIMTLDIELNADLDTALYKDEGHVDVGYLPKFKALNLFKVPARHCVSYVTPFTTGGRYSLIGWFRR
jgi:hypothetical protein